MRALGVRLLTVATVAVGWAALVNATPAAADTPVDEVHYTFLGSTSVDVDWRGTATDLQYGLTTAYGSTATGMAPDWTPPSSPGPFYHAPIAGLAAGTTYHYSIGSGPDYTFHTPPTGQFRFDAIGDIGDTSKFGHLGDTLSAIASDLPSFVLMIGDLTYANAAGSTQTVVDQHFNDMMNTWATSAAYIPAWGNHEWESEAVDDLRNYKGRLLMPNAQPAVGSPAVSCCGNDWGYFDAGGVRFISYPEPYASNTWTDWQSHAITLMTAAQNDPNINFVITFGHRPAYSTGYHPGDTKLAGILDTLGNTYSKYVLNINGHSHDYERFQPINGVTHVTVGTPSSEELPWSGTDSRTAVRAMHLAHLRVDVDSQGLLIQAICDDPASHDDTTCAAGSVLDEYAIGTPPAEPPVTAAYVDNTNAACSDTGPGSVEMPYCTITKGTSRLLPGQTLFVGNGTYPEQISPTNSGTATEPITITAIAGTNPVVGTSAKAHGIYLSGKHYVNISGLTVSGTTSDGVYVTSSDHINLSGLHVTTSGQPTADGYAKGMKIISTTASTVTGSTVNNNTDSGIYLAQGATGNIVSGNTAYGNARQYTRAAPGIDLRSGPNTVINNISHDNEDTGIQLYTGSDGSLVANNVVYHNGDHGIDDYQAPNQTIISNTVYANVTSGINLEGGSSGGLVENNISMDNGVGSPRSVGDIRVDATAQTGTTVDYNLVYLHTTATQYVWGTTNYASLAAFASASGQEAHGLEADPRLANANAGNFALTSGSPAIDSGNSAVSGERATDIVGVARYDDPAVPNGPGGFDDRGAYEAPAGTTDIPPTAALTVSPASGSAPLNVTADASASTDPDATPIATYAFNFGDGTTVGPQAGATATHTYSAAGTYTVTVTVTDTGGLASTASKTVVVNPPNLVTNSGFETNLTGWAALAGCNLTRVSGGHSGSWSANLNNPLTTSQTCTLNDSPNWVLTSAAGTYHASAWIRTSATGGQIKFRIREYVGSTLVGTGTATLNPNGSWQQVTLSYTVVSPGSTLDLNVYQTTQPAGSDLQIDDVSLTAP